MTHQTAIEWTHGQGYIGVTWNPLIAYNVNTGARGHFCVRISDGCTHCYAATQNVRQYPMGTGVDYRAQDRHKVRLDLHEPTLNKLLSWQQPHMVFVCSMTDLFLEDHPDEWLDRIFDVMESRPQHIKQVLTKRTKRARQYLSRRWAHREPPADIWLLATTENQHTANERIPDLLATPAAVKGLSCEPLLGPIDLGQAHPCGYYCDEAVGHVDHDFWTPQLITTIKWVIIGGESGPGCREMNMAWAESLFDQCQLVNCPVFVKQLGGHPDKRAGDKAILRNLTWKEFPR